MARQIIDVGSFPNSRDGDKLRDAVIKINANTEELYNDNGTIYGILETKVDKVVGETLTPNKFTDADVLKLANAESVAGAQAKADTAETNAKTYADAGDATLQTQIDNRALIPETGYALTADQASASIHLRDKDNNIISTLNVGFLNNEGTTLFYNSVTEEIEIKNDVGEILSTIPVSAFVTNTTGDLTFNGATLELRDQSNNIVSSVTIQIANVSGLQAALDSKETIANVDTKVLAAETNAIDWVKQFGIGTTVTTYEGDLDLLSEGGLVYAGSSATNKPNADNGWVIHQPLDANNSAQIFMSSSGMFTRVEIAGVFSAWDQKETVTGAQTKANTAESNANTYTDTGLSTKVDKIAGKGLSTEDYTTAEKNIVATAESVTGAQDKANTAEANAKAYADTGDANLQSQIDTITTGDAFVDTTSNESIGGIKTFTANTNFQMDIYVTGSISEGGQTLATKYETPSGAQTKANLAESNANSYTDTGLSTKVDKVAGKGLSTEDFTTAEKTKLSTAESVTGAQAKADAAEQAAKDYADVGDANLQSQIDSLTTGDAFVDTTSNESIGGIKTFTANTNFQMDIYVTGSISEGGQTLASKYETPAGAQTKADAAVSTANSYTDSGLSTKVDKVAGKALSTEDFTTALKTKLEALESDKFYEHNQGTPATVWNVTHNLNKYPSVTVTDSAGTVMIGEVTYVSLNEVSITFKAGFSGKAEFN